MPSLNTHEIRSPEMQEVMSEIPGSFLKWGLFLFFAIIMTIVAVSYFISYPVIVTVPVTITTYNSPASLITKAGGKIAELFVGNGESVSEKQPVACIENQAFYEDVLKVISFSDSLKTKPDWKKNIGDLDLPSGLVLGEIQTSYTRFCSTWQKFEEYIRQAYIPSKLDNLEKQIVKQEEYTVELMTQRGLSEEDLQLAINSYERDSGLFVKSPYSISIGQLEKSKQVLLQRRSSFSSLRASIKNNESSTLRMKESKLDLQVQYANEMQQYMLDLEESLQILQVAIGQWKEKYLIESPVKGKVTFTTYWNKNQVIKPGEVLATIIPDDERKIFVRAKVSVAGLGRVKEGQEVNIKLSGFPYLEFGVIKGRIKSLSGVPVEGVYIAEIDLINNMRSTYNTDISFVQEMDGTADIITEESRLIYKFIKPLQSIMKK
jgi:multidrug efflux pump subunit AcrA (membrane-fusion protein)